MSSIQNQEPSQIDLKSDYLEQSLPKEDCCGAYQDLSPDNQRALERLNRAIELSQGEFSLILAVCNSPQLRKVIHQQLLEISPVKIQEIILHPSVQTLFTTVQTALQEYQPNALTVFGLESVVSIDDLLAATNLVRDVFSEQFSFPLVLWVNDDSLGKLIRISPDFKSWATSTIRFQQVIHQPNDNSQSFRAITA